MTWALQRAQARWDNRFVVALTVLWLLVAWRTGLPAIGYALLALVADVQTVIGDPFPQTVPTRTPEGWVVELTANTLRDAWWITPYLQHAHSIFVLGALASVLLFMTKGLIMARQRARHDAIYSAQIDRFIDTSTNIILERIPAIARNAWRGLFDTNCMVSKDRSGSHPLAGPNTPDAPTCETLGAASQPEPEVASAETSPSVEQPSQPLERPVPQPSQIQVPGDAIQCAGEPHPPVSSKPADEPQPTSPEAAPVSPHTWDFFTRF